MGNSNNNDLVPDVKPSHLLAKHMLVEELTHNQRNHHHHQLSALAHPFANPKDLLNPLAHVYNQQYHSMAHYDPPTGLSNLSATSLGSLYYHQHHRDQTAYSHAWKGTNYKSLFIIFFYILFSNSIFYYITQIPVKFFSFFKSLKSQNYKFFFLLIFGVSTNFKLELENYILRRSLELSLLKFVCIRVLVCVSSVVVIW